MSKARRARKLDRLRKSIDAQLAADPPPTPWPEPFRTRMNEAFRAMITPELVAETNDSVRRMDRIIQQTRTLAAAIDRYLGQARPGVLGSNRTKRLRKKRSASLLRAA